MLVPRRCRNFRRMLHVLLIAFLLCGGIVDAYQLPSRSRRLSIDSLLQTSACKPTRMSTFHVSASRQLSMALPALSVPIHQPDDSNWWVWSLLAATSSVGIVLENTKIGAMLSSPLVTMGLSLILCNIGVLPSSSPVYSVVMKVIVRDFCITE